MTRRFSDRFLDAKRSIDTIDYYQESMKKNLPKFPAVDCPREYKECLSALSGQIPLGEYLAEKLGALADRSILDVIAAKDYAALEQYIFECVALDISGPGSY